MAKKDTAHRPSQGNQEYVTTADGRKVRNTAYKPNPKHEDGAVAAKTSKDELRSDFSGSSHGVEPGDVSETLSEGFDSLESILDVLEQKNTPPPDNHGEIHSLSKNLYDAQQEIVNNLYEVLHGYGIEGVTTEKSIMPTLTGDVEKHTVTFDSTDPNIPASMNTFVEETLAGPIDHTTILFKEGNELGVQAVRFSRQDHFLGVDSVTTYTASGDKITDLRYAHGDTEHFENHRLLSQTINPKSMRNINLDMWRNYDPSTLDELELRSVHASGMAKDATVTYRYNDDESRIQATWEEDGKQRLAEYEIVDVEGGDQLGVPVLRD